jgi:cytoskeletal protein RodZ
MKDIMLIAFAVFAANPIIWTIVIFIALCVGINWWQNFRDAANEWVRKLP